jgi:integrase
VRLGFLEFVTKCKKTAQVRLFPELKKGNNGYGDAVGKWFGRLKVKHGITDDAKVLHSLRHGGITKLHAVGCQDNIVKMISGHTEEGVHGRTYVHREHIPLSLMQKVLEKLRYDDVVKALLSER